MIGQGQRVAGASSFEQVDFSSARYWLQIDIQEDGNFVEISKQQLWSVPYAKVAETVKGASLVPAGMIMPYAGPVERIPKAGFYVMADHLVNLNT